MQHRGTKTVLDENQFNVEYGSIVSYTIKEHWNKLRHAPSFFGWRMSGKSSEFAGHLREFQRLRYLFWMGFLQLEFCNLVAQSSLGCGLLSKFM